jgi:hypothetical protein
VLLARLLPLVLLLACSGKPSDPVHPRGGTARPDAGAVHVAEGGPSDPECEVLVAHAVELGMAELRAHHPLDQLPDERELDQLAADLRAEGGCRALSRDGYRCGLAATTLSELGACAKR